jgi:hypothetical protein
VRDIPSTPIVDLFGHPDVPVNSPDMAGPRDSHGKALALNLDSSVYGTLAEIGAGQEVARWFLGVGAASGTVAKTISAYDKTVSDEIYGAGTRYVSKERLLAMLDHEYVLVRDRLSALRGGTTRFFVFADTIAVRNYQGTNEPHGWLGIRFQAEPGAEPSQALLHINLCDATMPLQQQAVGILGVNLVYAAFHETSTADAFLAGVFDGLSSARVEIDVLEFSGPAFAGHETRVWCLDLLRRDMAHALVFDSRAQIVEPSSILRKRPLLVMRGSLSYMEHFGPTVFEAARNELQAEGLSSPRAAIALQELTIDHATRIERFDAGAILTAIEALAPDAAVMVSDFSETHLLSRYLRRHSMEPTRFILSVAAAAKILHDAFYEDLPGRLLEGVGRLLAANVKLYVAPMPRAAFLAALGNLSGRFEAGTSDGGLVTLDNFMPSHPNRHLLDYLRVTGRIVALPA